MPQPLFIFTQAPNNNTQAREGIEALLACAAFDKQPEVMFIDQGVLQLIPQADYQGVKNLNKMAQALELYGVQSIYICKASLAHFGLEPAELKPLGQLIHLQARPSIIQRAAWVACF